MNEYLPQLTKLTSISTPSINTVSSKKATSINNSIKFTSKFKATNQARNSITPIKLNASNLSMSSPSAAVLFTLNSNSFTIPNENCLNNSLSISNSASKLLASKVEYISGTAELQTIVNDDNKIFHHLNKSDLSTDLSCIDDSVINAFINDFSYEIVQK